MGAHEAPAVPVCLGLLVGCGLGWWLEPGLVTTAAGAALGSVALLWPARKVTLGLLAGWIVTALVLPGSQLAATIDTSRPVEVTGRNVGYWSRSIYGWSSRFRIDSLQQGLEESRGPSEVLLTLPQGPVLPNGARLRVRGYLRRPKPLRNGPQRAPPLWRLSLKSIRLATVEPGRHSLIPQAPRRRVVAALERRGATAGAAVARALLLGETGQLPPAWLATLRHAGLGQLVAVSGLHVGLAIAIAWLACAAMRPRLRLIPAALMVMGYLMLVGGRPSVVRSGLMAWVALSSLALERKPSSLNGWAVAVIVVVLMRPAVVLSLGFQLTVAATFGLLTLAPMLTMRWAVIPEPLRTGLAASVAAHITTLPWSLAVFHVWTPAAILLNLVAVPWTALALTLAMAAVALDGLPGLGEILWVAMDIVAKPFGWLSTLPPGPLTGRPVVAGWGSALAVTGTLSLAAGRPGASTCAMALAALVLIVVLPLPGGDLEMVVLDVGQGDAILLRDGRQAVLVDGGGSLAPGIAARELVPALRRQGLSRLDGVVLTHPDLDHCGGLLELSLLIPVDRLWSAGGWPEACYRRLILRPRLTVIPVWRSEAWQVGRWRIEVLHPAPATQGGGNARSLVLRASAGGHAVLLTGDTGLREEETLIRSEYDLGARILKLGHHGSRSSTGEAFLKDVQPRIAVVSAGLDNRYSHPAEEVLERLKRLGVPVYRTDLGGQIRLRFDPGRGVLVEQPWAAPVRPP
jgi:competence protein ComEC